MRTSKKQTQPFRSAAQFFRETNFQQHLDRFTEGVQIRRAFESVGFRLRKIRRERIRFDLTTAWATRPAEDEQRTMNAVRRAILAAFKAEGLPLRAEFLLVRLAGRRVVATASLVREQP